MHCCSALFAAAHCCSALFILFGKICGLSRIRSFPRAQSHSLPAPQVTTRFYGSNNPFYLFCCSFLLLLTADRGLTAGELQIPPAALIQKLKAAPSLHIITQSLSAAASRRLARPVCLPARRTVSIHTGRKSPQGVDGLNGGMVVVVVVMMMMMMMVVMIVIVVW